VLLVEQNDLVGNLVASTKLIPRGLRISDIRVPVVASARRREPLLRSPRTSSGRWNSSAHESTCGRGDDPAGPLLYDHSATTCAASEQELAADSKAAARRRRYGAASSRNSARSSHTLGDGARLVVLNRALAAAHGATS